MRRPGWDGDDRPWPKGLFLPRPRDPRRAGAGAGETIRGWNGYGSTRIAGQRARPADGRCGHADRLCADPDAGRAPGLGHLSPAGAARGLASRPDPGAGGGGRRRALVGIFLLFAVLRLLSRAAERDPQSGPVHGGCRGDQPPRELDEEADRDRAQAREGNERPLRVLAPAGGGLIGRRHLPRDRGASRQSRPAQRGAVRCRRRRRSTSPSRAP